MPKQPPDSGRRPGRPRKFDRPSRVVALTLPEDVIDRLHRVHRDLGWAIVKMLDEQSGPAVRREAAEPDVALVTVADRRSLIVVNREVIRNLPGVNIIPFSGNRAFLALDIDRGLSDLELAVSDRLADGAVEIRERRAMTDLQSHLRSWRHDRTLLFHTRAIIVIERTADQRSERQNGAAARQRAARRRRLARTGAGRGTSAGRKI